MDPRQIKASELVVDGIACEIKRAELYGGSIDVIFMTPDTIADFAMHRKIAGETGFDPLRFMGIPIRKDESLPEGAHRLGQA